MQVFAEKSGKIIIPRSFYVKILILLLLVGASNAALKPVQALIGSAISNIRANLISRLEAFTGMEIRYSSIRPAFFTSFDVRGIAFYKGDTEVLTIQRARIYFSLRELLLRKKTVVHTIQIDHPSIHLDWERDSELFELIKSFSGSGSGDKMILKQIAEFLPEKTNYRIRGLSFSLTYGESSFGAENVIVSVTRDKNTVTLDAASDFEVVYAGFWGSTLSAAVSFNLRGVYLADSREGEGKISFSQFVFGEPDANKQTLSFFDRILASVSPSKGRLFTVSPFAADFSFNENAVSFSTAERNDGSGFYGHYDAQAGELSAEINLNNFTVNSAVNLSGSLKELGYLLDTAVNGRLSFNYKNLKDFNYTVLLRGGNAAEIWDGKTALSDAFLLDAYGDNGRVVVNDFHVNASSILAQSGFFQGIVSYSGSVGFSPFRPAGAVSVSGFSLTGKESLNGVFEISSRGRDILISGSNVYAGAFSPQTLDISLYPSDRDIGVSVSSFFVGGGELFLDAVLNKNPNRLEASLFVSSFSLAGTTGILRPFVNFADIPAAAFVFTGDTLLDAEVFVSSDYKNFAYNVSSVISGKGGVIGRLSLSGTDRNLSLREGVFYLDKNELYVSANANFANPMDFDFSLNAKYLDVSWNITGEILDKTTLIIQEPNGLHVYGNKSGSGAVSGYIEGVNFPVPAVNRPAYMDFYVTLRYNSRDFWSIDASHFKIRDLYSRNGLVNLGFSGSADQDGANLKDVLFNDSIGTLAGGADFFWNAGFSSLSFSAGMANDVIASGERYFLEGTLNGDNVNVNASVSDIRVDRFINGNGAMLATAKAEVSWNSVDSFNAEINLSSFSAGTRAKPINASVDVFVSNNGLSAENLEVSYSNVKTVFPVFYLKPAEGAARVTASLSGIADKRNIEGTIDLEAGFTSVDSWINIRQILSSINGTLQVENFQFGDLSQDKTVFVFSSNDGAVSISGGVRDMLKIEMDKGGNLFASLSDPLPIRGSFTGEFKNFYFDVYSNDYYIDLASLWALASGSTEHFNIAGGYINGKMNLKGPVRNPEFSGTGRCTSLRLQIPGVIAGDLRAVPFDILAEGYEMIFGPVETVSGNGSGITSGWFLFENWIPKNIGLDITVPEKTPIPYNLIVAGFRADGDVSGKLDILINSLNDKYIEIKGELYMNNTEMAYVKPSESERTKDSDFNTIINLSITTGPMADFFWPNKNSPILRVSPEIRTVLFINSDTQAGHFSINSDIKIKTGEIYYLDRNFHIREGNLIFRENETQFNPRVNVKADIRERTDTGPVTISMIIENQPLLTFVPRFEAIPGLTQLEIYSILGQNFNVEGAENTGLAQRFLLATSTDLLGQIISGSDVFTQLNFIRQFERGVRTFFHLDLFSIRTRLLQNMVGSSAAAFGSSPVDRTNLVGNYFDNTTVFIGKYIGQDMFIQGSLALKYDGNGGIRLEPDIGVEFQTPFINIRWDFFPYNPKNWWVNDHSITLIWSRSFK